MSLINSFAEKFGMSSNEEALSVLKMTCFSNGFTPFNSDSALVLIQKAMEMDLNPFSGDVYVAEQKDLLGVSQGYYAEIGQKGWMKIANRCEDYNGVEFEMSDSFISLASSFTHQDGSPVVITGATWVKARVFMKGIEKPFETIEYLDECFSPYSQAWAKNPKRRLRQVTFGQSVLLATYGKEKPNYISITNDDISEFDKFVDSLSFELLSEESLDTKKSNVTAYFKEDAAKAKAKAKAKADEAVAQAKADEAAAKAKADEAAAKAKADEAVAQAKADEAVAQAKADEAVAQAKADEAAAKAKADEEKAKAIANSEVILVSGRIAQSISGYLDEAEHVAIDDSSNKERAEILSELLLEVDNYLSDLDGKLEIATGDVAGQLKSARNIFKNRTEKLRSVQKQAETKAKIEAEEALKDELDSEAILQHESDNNKKVSSTGISSVDEYLTNKVEDHMRQEFKDTDFVLMLISEYLDDSALFSKNQLLGFISPMQEIDKQWSTQKLYENGLIDKEFVQEILNLAA